MKIEITKENAPDGQPGVRATYRDLPGCSVWGVHERIARWELERFRAIYEQEMELQNLPLDTPREEHSVRIEMTKAQARIISHACDLYSRIQGGQLEEIRREVTIKRAEELRDLFDFFRECAAEATGLPRNANHGIGSPALRDTARIAYDIHQVVRHRLAWDDNPKGGIQVTYDTPMRWSALVGLPRMRTVDGDRYELAITETHTRVIKEACELVARLGMGQLDIAADVWDMGQTRRGEEQIVAYYRLLSRLRELEPEVTGRPLGGYPGIRNPEVGEAAQIAWDIHRALRVRPPTGSLVSGEPALVVTRLGEGEVQPS